MSSNAYRRASLKIQKSKGPKWKQELVSDHKFDFIDVDGFRDTSCLLTIRYFILLCSVMVSTLVYGADLWTAGILLIYDHWSLSTQPKIPFNISKWIYVGCIIISFMLLSWEILKTRAVMETRDISLAVTNPLAYRTYSVKSYNYFCLLRKIKNSTKWSDVIIFYVFYVLKTWKRVIIAQGPRQIIAGFTVFALLKSAWTDPDTGYFRFSSDWDTYGEDWPQRVALFSMSFTCILWVISAFQIVLAVLLYFPILCQIQGNLKEYCCHKIDKRIDELLEKERKKRVKEREKKYANSVSSKKSKKSSRKNTGDNDVTTVPAVPTLPVINDVSLYAGEKTDDTWLYQHPQQQHSFSNYYDSQPMTPLESSYSLQRNTTKYNPYNETFYTNSTQRQSMYNPTGAYTQQESTSNYYYPSSNQHYNTNSLGNTNNGYYSTADASNINKPNVYSNTSPVIENTPAVNSSNTLHSSYYEPPAASESYTQLTYNNSTYQTTSTSRDTMNMGVKDTYLPNNNIQQNQQEDMQDDAFIYNHGTNAGGNSSHQMQDQYAYQDDAVVSDPLHVIDTHHLSNEAIQTKPVIKPETYSNYI